MHQVLKIAHPQSRSIDQDQRCAGDPFPIAGGDGAFGRWGGSGGSCDAAGGAWRFATQPTAVFAKAHPGRRQRAFEALRSTGLVAARSASSSDSSRLFERSERSERSELRDGPRARAPQGSRSKAQTASTKRCRLPGRAFAAPYRPFALARNRNRNPQPAPPKLPPAGCRLPLLFDRKGWRLSAVQVRYARVDPVQQRAALRNHQSLPRPTAPLQRGFRCERTTA